jgi:hypothetical protein
MDKCRSELESYIDSLVKESLVWYESRSDWNYRLWHGFTFLAVISGFLSSLLAALTKAGLFKEWGSVLLIVLPATGSLAAILLNQFHFADLEDIRERGRIEIQDLIDWAKISLAAAKDEETCFNIYEELRKKVKDLELSQHAVSNRVYAKHRAATSVDQA